MSMLLTAALGVGVGVALAAVFLAVGRKAFAGRSESRMFWWSATSVALGYAGAHIAIARPSFPPLDVTDRAPIAAAAACVVVVIESFLAPGAIRYNLTRLILAAITLSLILAPIVLAADDGLPRETVIWMAGSAAVVLAAWFVLSALPRAGLDSQAFLAAFLTTAGASLVLVISGSLVLGQLAAALAAIMLTAWAITWGKLTPGYLPVALAVVTCLVLVGFVYASVPAGSAACLAVAPATAWLTRIGPLRRLGPWATAAISSIAVLIPVGIAIGLAVSSSPTDGY